MIETLKTLCALSGVSSFEDEVRDYIRNRVAPYADSLREGTYAITVDSSSPMFNIIACVLMMSMIMTVVGPTVGHLMEGVLTAEPIFDWPGNWPVNFCVAFLVEMLVAQPAARHVMKRRHIRRFPI